MLDCRNINRGFCKSCGIHECPEYEKPLMGNRCDYCGCLPTKHIRNYDSTYNSKDEKKEEEAVAGSSEVLTKETVGSNELTRLLHQISESGLNPEGADDQHQTFNKLDDLDSTGLPAYHPAAEMPLPQFSEAVRRELQKGNIRAFKMAVEEAAHFYTFLRNRRMYQDAGIKMISAFPVLAKVNTHGPPWRAFTKALSIKVRRIRIMKKKNIYVVGYNSFCETKFSDFSAHEQEDCEKITDSPMEVTDKAMEVTDKAMEVTDKAMEVTYKPMEVTYKPMEVTYKPMEVTDKPMKVTDKPMKVTDKPMKVTDKPMKVTDKPMKVTDKPMKVTDKPMKVTDKPMKVTDKPMKVTDKPMKVTDKPMIVTDKPMTVTDKPMTVTDKPMTVTDKPMTVTDKPMKLKNLDLNQTNSVSTEKSARSLDLCSDSKFQSKLEAKSNSAPSDNGQEQMTFIDISTESLFSSSVTQLRTGTTDGLIKSKYTTTSTPVSGEESMNETDLGLQDISTPHVRKRPGNKIENDTGELNESLPNKINFESFKDKISMRMKDASDSKFLKSVSPVQKRRSSMRITRKRTESMDSVFSKLSSYPVKNRRSKRIMEKQNESRNSFSVSSKLLQRPTDEQKRVSESSSEHLNCSSTTRSRKKKEVTNELRTQEHSRLEDPCFGSAKKRHHNNVTKEAEETVHNKYVVVEDSSPAQNNKGQAKEPRSKLRSVRHRGIQKPSKDSLPDKMKSSPESVQELPSLDKQEIDVSGEESLQQTMRTRWEHQNLTEKILKEENGSTPYPCLENLKTVMDSFKIYLGEQRFSTVICNLEHFLSALVEVYLGKSYDGKAETVLLYAWTEFECRTSMQRRKKTMSYSIIRVTADRNDFDKCSYSCAGDVPFAVICVSSDGKNIVGVCICFNGKKLLLSTRKQTMVNVLLHLLALYYITDCRFPPQYAQAMGIVAELIMDDETYMLSERALFQQAKIIKCLTK